ncbi:hypothetical protein P4O66_004204 [Electrophorus voltai]|uniref:CCHC-type domain-containing protein n=1 Tax=Electrophorus voltai TaxID=2609070 RepID=A0AAD9E551_9TELE|nr:hypothetical protein P4O66_004204 [Electrophorus voltai]
MLPADIRSPFQEDIKITCQKKVSMCDTGRDQCVKKCNSGRGLYRSVGTKYPKAQLVRTAEQRPLEHRLGTAGDLEDLRRISGPEPATGEQMADGGSPDGGPRSPGLAGGASAEAPEPGGTTPTEPGLGAGGGGLLNTARFRWENPGDGTVFTERVLFIREVLFGALGLTPGDLICVQRNGPLGYYDVTLSIVENYRRVLDRRVELQRHPVGKYYVVDPLWDGNRRVVTTHVFNPHVSTDLVRRFLQEYGTVHPGERMVRDELGIWNGRRQYQVSFKEDGKGGLVHPPALFAIDGNRGYLFYRDQPVFCRSCRGQGHRMEDCPELECLNCLEKGHLARDCRGPRRCRRCRSEGHLARSCPGSRTYAAAVVRGTRDCEEDSASTGEQAGLREAMSQEIGKAPAVVRKRMRAGGRIPGEDSRGSKAKRADFDFLGDGGGEAQEPGKSVEVFLNDTGFREFVGLGDKWEGVMSCGFDAQLVRTAEQRPLEHRPGTAGDLEDLRRISGPEPATGEQMADGGSPDGGPRSPGLASGASAEALEPGRTAPTEPGLGAGGGGLLNTARFRWENPGDGTVFTERVLFIREVLFGALGLTPGDLICAQRNGPLGFYDVTLSTAENYRRVLDRRVELQHHPVGKYYVVDPLWDGNRRVVTTHVFNPHVPTDLIRRFLQEYGTVHPGERMVRDELGIWNGRRQYQMSFKEDGKGGLVYPPALFAIDGNRGYLFYRDQPVFCRSCRGHGHKMEDCPELECLNCLEKGHLARDCRGPRRCRQCRREGHLARSCPGGRTYAVAVVRGTRDRVVDTASTGEQAEPEDGQLEAGQSQETVKAPAVVRKRMRASGRIPGEDSRSTKAKRAGKGEAAPKSPPTFAPGPDSTGSFPSPSPLVMDFDFVGDGGGDAQKPGEGVEAQLVRTAEQRPLEHRLGTAGDLEDLRRISGPEPATGEQMADGGSPDGGPRSPGLAGGASAEAPEPGGTTPTEPGLGAGGGGLLNTARFRWENPGDGTVFTERVLFIREVLFGALGLTPGDLICVQRNGPLGYYDVTLSTVENYRRVLDRRVELQRHPVGKYYVVDPLWDGNRRVVTTHVFNPHVSTDLVRRFLQEYGTVHPGERMVRDELGIWNGRRQYQVSFKEDGKGGLVHPPALFAIDGAARVNWAERLAHARKKLGLWKSRSLSFLGKVLALKADVLPSLLYLAHVYPMPRSMRRGLTKDVFNLVWGGKYEYVRREVMYLGKDKGGRDVPDFPLKLDCLFFAQLCARLAAPLEHPHQYFIRLWLSWPLRKVVRTWSNSGPKAETLPEHFDHMVRWSKSLPAGLRPESLAKHRLLYKTVLEARGTRAVVGLEEDTWSRVQPKGLDNRLQDLNWRCIHGKLPVRDVLYRHGLTRHPRCPRPNCAEEETLRHVFWDCGYARDVWGKVADLCRTLDPQFQLTYNKVTWGWPQDTKPSFAPRMWELAQLVRTAEQRPLEHRPGTAGDLEDLRRISGPEPATGEQMADGGSPDGGPRSPGLASGASAEALEPGRTAPTEPGLGAGGGGLLNTARFRWENPGDGTVFTERVLFIREVLFGALGLTPGDLICAQRNGPLGFYDVTLSTAENYRRVLDRRVELQHHPVGKYYVVDPLWDGNRRVVTTHVFNPHVPTDLIRRFLQEYGTVHPGERMVRDELGIWNGRRQYQMSFKEDGKGGLVYPPALFAIDGNRGYLFYRDQPVFCRSCRGHGHKMEDCPELECLNCLEKGHLARDCRGPRRCRQCRREGHLARSCPGGRTYAVAVVRGTRDRVVDTASTGEQAEPEDGQLEAGQSQETVKAPAVVRKRMRASGRIPGEDSRSTKAKRAGKGEAAPKSPPTFAPGPDSTGSFPPSPPGLLEAEFPLEAPRLRTTSGGPVEDFCSGLGWRIGMAAGGPRGPERANGASAEASDPWGTASAEPGSGAGGGSLLDTARFRWRDLEDGPPFMDRVPFIREVLFGVLGLKPEDLICAQRNGPQGFFDVTFSSTKVYRRVLEQRVQLKSHLEGRWFEVEPLWDGARRLVTTHMFNPHVPTDQIRRFLQMYGEVLPGERYVRDELGIWNGRRQFMMNFREKVDGGWVYPPALFLLGGNRGYLFFRDQPAFCRGCQGHGHKVEECKDLRCLNCLGAGHMARDCKGPRRCRICWSEEHLARTCPTQRRTYLAVAAGCGKGGPAAPFRGVPVGEPKPGKEEAVKKGLGDMGASKHMPPPSGNGSSSSGQLGEVALAASSRKRARAGTGTISETTESTETTETTTADGTTGGDERITEDTGDTDAGLRGLAAAAAAAAAPPPPPTTTTTPPPSIGCLQLA